MAYDHKATLTANLQFAQDEVDATRAQLAALQARLVDEEENLAYCKQELAEYDEEE